MKFCATAIQLLNAMMGQKDGDPVGVPTTYGRDRYILLEIRYTESLGKDFLTILCAC